MKSASMVQDTHSTQLVPSIPLQGTSASSGSLSTLFSPRLFYFLLQDQLQLNCGLCNSIDSQICLESILILFKGQSIESSLGLSEMNFIFHTLNKVEGESVLLFKGITA